MAISGGRKPKPGRLRALEGNREHRPMPKPHPLDATDRLPTCPGWLSSDQKRVWRDTVREIKIVLAPADREVLAAFCVQVDLHRKCAEAVNVGGVMLRGRSRGAGSTVVKNPADSQLNQHARLIVTMGAELGLTPAARTRLMGAGMLPPDTPYRSRAERLLS